MLSSHVQVYERKAGNGRTTRKKESEIGVGGGGKKKL